MKSVTFVKIVIAKIYLQMMVSIDCHNFFENNYNLTHIFFCKNRKLLCKSGHKVTYKKVS